MEPITANSPYSLENFKWLMEHSSVQQYLLDESLMKIEESLKSGDETVLCRLYPIILEQFITERDINVQFAISQESAMHAFVVGAEKAGYKVKAEYEERKQSVEKKEHTEAENILKNIS